MFMDIWIHGFDIYKWLLLLITSFIVYKTTTISVQRNKQKQNKNETKTEEKRKKIIRSTGQFALHYEHYPGAIGITFRFMKDSFRNNFLVCWSSHPGFMRAHFQVNKAQFRVSRGHTSRLWELTSRFNESSLPSLWQPTSELHESSLPGFTKDRIACLLSLWVTRSNFYINKPLLQNRL